MDAVVEKATILQEHTEESGLGLRRFHGLVADDGTFELENTTNVTDHNHFLALSRRSRRFVRDRDVRGLRFFPGETEGLFKGSCDTL